MYELELDRVVEEINDKGAKRVLLQLPDGIRPFAFQMADYLVKATGIEIILSGDSCYGACDLATRQARELNADLLVHYGHACFVKESEVPIFYVEARISIDIEKLVEVIAPHLEGWRSVGLTSTIQHTTQLQEVAESLRSKGINTFIGDGAGVTPENGQVLGCSYAAATNLLEDVDGYLFIGGGRFHPLGLALSTGKPVVVANPYNGTVLKLGDFELMQLAKRRMAAITAAKNVKTLGVLVSSKPGQRAIETAKELTRKLTNKGFSTRLIYLDEIRAEALNNFTEPGAFIDTACPRIAVDGVTGINRPILTAVEAEVLLGERSWEETWGHDYFV